MANLFRGRESGKTSQLEKIQRLESEAMRLNSHIEAIMTRITKLEHDNKTLSARIAELEKGNQEEISKVTERIKAERADELLREWFNGGIPKAVGDDE